MATLTVQARQTDPTEDPADAGGDEFANDGATELLVINTGLAQVTVTATAQRRCSHGFLDNWSLIAEPDALLRFGPFEPSRFNDANGRVQISYSSTANVTVAAQRQR